MNLNLVLLDVNCLPTKATKLSAGFDVRARIKDLISVGQFGVVKVPLGFCIQIPAGWVGDIRPRSGHSIKGITAELGTLDPDYTGEACAIITNNTNTPYHIQPYERVGQLVIVRSEETITFNLVDQLDPTDRGAGGFGHTGK